MYSYAIYEGIEVVKATAYQGICEGNCDLLMVTTLFANLIDTALKGETSIKHNSKIANFFHRMEVYFQVYR